MPYADTSYWQRVASPAKQLAWKGRLIRTTYILLAALGVYGIVQLAPSAIHIRQRDTSAMKQWVQAVADQQQPAIDDVKPPAEEVPAEHAPSSEVIAESPAPPPPPPSPPKPPIVEPVVWSERQPVVVPREPSWVEAQYEVYPRKTLTSHAFEEAQMHSINPPPVDVGDLVEHPALKEVLRKKLIIGIALGASSKHTNVPEKGLFSLPVFNTLLPSFFGSAQPHHIYRIYLAYDHDDPIYDSEHWRTQIMAEFQRLVMQADSAQWHPPGYIPNQTIDESTVMVSLHFVHCDFAKKPSWAHSDAVMAAYKEGADYVFRTNDDTAFPLQKDWVDRFVLGLRSRAIANLGSIGPSCDIGPQMVLTHDFTHRTHAVMFGFHYPRSLPNWSSDDWITYVYEQFGYALRAPDVKVQHMLHAQRYDADPQALRLKVLNFEIAAGAKVIHAFVKEHFGVELEAKAMNIECC